MRPILLPLGPGLPSVNHRLPSGPLVMSFGLLPAVGIGNSLKVAAKARSAPPPTVHGNTITASSRRRYLFCMCFPPWNALHTKHACDLSHKPSRYSVYAGIPANQPIWQPLKSPSLLGFLHFVAQSYEVPHTPIQYFTTERNTGLGIDGSCGRDKSMAGGVRYTPPADRHAPGCL